MNMKNTMHRAPSCSRGFSLVELMVAMVAGLIVSGAVLAFTMSSFRSNGDYVRSTRLTQELRNTMDLVTRELRRAGYDDNALSYLARGTGSPFTHMSLATAGATANTFKCVLYAYDRTTHGGTHGVIDVDNGELRGIRVATRSVNNRNVGVLEYFESSGSIQPSCSGASPDYTTNPATCNATSGWCPLSDGTTLDIVTFELTDNRSLVGTAPTQVQLRDIGVLLQARLAGSTEFTRGMQSSVRVRSECYDTTMSHCSNTPAP
jgi:prepilin-type N-terminal cleavage/methylation domain-containing protein